MNHTLLIFLGSGIGGVLRFWISKGIYLLINHQFPYGTLFVNTTGCFLMGLLYVITTEKIMLFSSEFRALLLIGLLGGYTTFSSFSIETLNLFENGQWLNGILNILFSVILCLQCSWLGIILGRNL